MKIDMKKEFENIKNYLENNYVEDFKGMDDDSMELVNLLQEMHLSTANEMIVLATLLENGELTESQNIEAERVLRDIFIGFMKLLPDKAFIDKV